MGGDCLAWTRQEEDTNGVWSESILSTAGCHDRPGLEDKVHLALVGLPHSEALWSTAFDGLREAVLFLEGEKLFAFNEDTESACVATLAEFLADNEDGLDPETLAHIKVLDVDGRFGVDQGAGGTWTVRRIF